MRKGKKKKNLDILFARTGASNKAFRLWFKDSILCVSVTRLHSVCARLLCFLPLQSDSFVWQQSQWADRDLFTNSLKWALWETDALSSPPATLWLLSMPWTPRCDIEDFWETPSLKTRAIKRTPIDFERNESNFSKCHLASRLSICAELKTLHFLREVRGNVPIHC